MASHYGIDGIPNIVLIGVPDKAALVEACGILSENQIPHWQWHEPDFDFGFTAIATAQISGEQRKCLAHYRLWKFVDHPWLNGKAPPSKGEWIAGSSPAG